MKALILTDIQNDFLPGGALPVPRGDEVIPIANQLIPDYAIVVATQDWHPADHGSFASQHPGHKAGDLINFMGMPQILWPDHCVQNTAGADFAAALNTKAIHKVFHKGTDKTIDSYSGLFDNGHRKSTGLAQWLKAQRIDEIDLVGLATDYCVKFSALDAAAEGFKTTVLLPGCRGINLKPGDIDQAIADMLCAGVRVSERV